MMRAVALSELAATVGGTVHGQDAAIQSVSTDTRSLQPGDTYFALSGEQFDGNAFAKDAIERGAAALVLKQPAETIEDQNLLCVPEPQIALAKLAGLQRKAFERPVVALTGSVGKTSTKEMLAGILSLSGPGLSTSGNFNNEVGVPLTLLRLKKDQQWAVIELGAAQTGDIKYLTDFVCPDVALVTTVAPSHLQSFGSMEAIAATKAEIYAGLDEEGVAILNLDNSWTAALRDKLHGKRVLSFSAADQSADVYASEILPRADAKIAATAYQFLLHTADSTESVALKVAGKHAVSNALAAAACAVALNVPLKNIVAGLESYAGVRQRMQVLEGLFGCSVIDDSYNANPASVKAAIDVLAVARNESGNTLRIFVMGTMGELGPDAEGLHAEVGRYARQSGIDCFYGVGELTAAAVNAFESSSQSHSRRGHGKHFDDHQPCIDHCLRQLSDVSDLAVILIKGSRSAKMEIVVDALHERQKDH